VPSTPAKESEPQDMHDAALLEAAKTGDESAWSEIVRRYSALVYSIPVRYGMDQAAADDVFQDAFAALLNQLPSIRDAKALPKWFITTTHRICWRTERRASRELALHDRPLDCEAPPEDHALRWERQHLVRLALDRLGGQCAELLTALYLSGGSSEYEQVARRLNMPIGSIGPTRGRCLRKMLTLLREMGFPPD
jgi:RNA polymerase sigma factor (sigma-70 family)